MVAEAHGNLKCPKCGFHVDVNARFCGSCGAPVTQICPVCGQHNGGGQRFCAYCGGDIASTLTGIPIERALAWKEGFERLGWWKLPFGNSRIIKHDAASDLLLSENLSDDPDTKSEPWLFSTQISTVDWSIEKIDISGNDPEAAFSQRVKGNWLETSQRFVIATRCRLLFFKFTPKWDFLAYWLYQDLFKSLRNSNGFGFSFKQGNYIIREYNNQRTPSLYKGDTGPANVVFWVKTAGVRFFDMAYLAGHYASGDRHEAGHLIAAANIANSKAAQMDFLEVIDEFCHDIASVGNLNKDNRDDDNWQDYNMRLSKILLEMGTKPNFQDKRKAFHPYIQMAFDPAFFPSLLVLVAFLGQKDDQDKAIADSIAAAVILEIRELLALSDISGLSPGAIAASLEVAPMVEGLEKPEEDKIVLGFVNAVINLYPRIKQVRNELNEHFNNMANEAETRSEVKDAKISQEMKDKADGWRKTSVLIRQIVDFMDVMETNDEKAINRVVSLDTNELMGISAMLTKTFEFLKESEQKNKVSVAFMKILLAQKEREK